MTKNTKKEVTDVADEKVDEQQRVNELTQDLQRTRADFENYRKRVDAEKSAAIELGRTQAVLKLLPIIDTIELAIAHIPEDLQDNAWAKGVSSITKNLSKNLDDLKLKRIKIVPGKTEFDPDFHQAVSIEEGEGDKEIVTEELQPGYLLNDLPIRHSMVRVANK